MRIAGLGLLAVALVLAAAGSASGVNLPPDFAMVTVGDTTSHRAAP